MAGITRTLDTLELIGGALCLDFVNTINSRQKPEHDYLIQYSDVIGWANKVGILSPTQKNQFLKRAKQNMEEATKTVESAQMLRELLYRLFSNAANNTEPNHEDMEALVSAYGESISHGQFIKADNQYKITWKMDEAFNAVLWPIAHSAGKLLLSSELNQVKECPGCGWFFMDTSKNQSRRWCSMNTCGARDKMRRYHKRKQTK